MTYQVVSAAPRSHGDNRSVPKGTLICPEEEWEAENIANLSRILINLMMLCRLQNILISIVQKMTVGRLNKILTIANHYILAILYSKSF